jgi:hypothetical protein
MLRLLPWSACSCPAPDRNCQVIRRGGASRVTRIGVLVFGQLSPVLSTLLLVLILSISFFLIVTEQLRSSTLLLSSAHFSSNLLYPPRHSSRLSIKAQDSSEVLRHPFSCVLIQKPFTLWSILGHYLAYPGYITRGERRVE